MYAVNRSSAARTLNRYAQKWSMEWSGVHSIFDYMDGVHCVCRQRDHIKINDSECRFWPHKCTLTHAQCLVHHSNEYELQRNSSLHTIKIQWNHKSFACLILFITLSIYDEQQNFDFFFQFLNQLIETIASWFPKWVISISGYNFLKTAQFVCVNVIIFGIAFFVAFVESCMESWLTSNLTISKFEVSIKSIFWRLMLV